MAAACIVITLRHRNTRRFLEYHRGTIPCDCLLLMCESAQPPSDQSQVNVLCVFTDLNQDFSDYPGYNLLCQDFWVASVSEGYCTWNF